MVQIILLKLGCCYQIPARIGFPGNCCYWMRSVTQISEVFVMLIYLTHVSVLRQMSFLVDLNSSNLNSLLQHRSVAFSELP